MQFTNLAFAFIVAVMDFASAIEDCLLQADKDFDELCSQLTKQ